LIPIKAAPASCARPFAHRSEEERMDAMDIGYLTMVIVAFVGFLGLMVYADSTTRR
jgi:hypothetical protein